MSQTFLVATDGTSTSKQSEQFVCEFLDQKEPDVELKIITVIEELDQQQLEQVLEDVNLENATSRRLKNAESILNQLQKQYKEAGFDTETAVLEGEAGEEICNYADEHDADGIFVGRGDHSQLGEMFYGSVSHYVLLHSNCSVIITPSANSEEDDNGVDYRASRMDK